MTESRNSIPLPPHVYIPGLSPRHPPQFFEGLKASVTPDTPISKLHETRAFVAGLTYFDAGFYWECHEVMEVVWRHTIDPSVERDMVLAVIQLANARLKTLMLQPRAAWRLCDIVETRLARCPADRPVLGLEAGDMRARLQSARAVSRDAMRSPY